MPPQPAVTAVRPPGPLLVLALLLLSAARDGTPVTCPPAPPLEVAEPAFAGRATDPRGAPLAGVHVWVLDFGSTGELRMLGPLEAAVTGTDGRFSATGLGREARLALCRPGYLTREIGPREIGPPSGPAVELTLERAASVSGRVFDAAGRPLAGARVAARQLDDSGIRFVSSGGLADGEAGPCPRDRSMRNVETGADGRFVIDHLEPELYRLDAAAPEHLGSSPLHLELAAGERALPDLLLERGAVLSGRVLGPDGSPLAGVRVQPWDGRSHRAEATSKPDGGFRLAGLEPGRRKIALTTPAGLWEYQEIELATGENRADLHLHRQGELRGRVVDAAGQPIAGAQVSQHGYPMDSSSTRSGADGSFALPAKDGVHELSAEAPGYAPALAESRVRVSGRPVEGLELRLAQGTTLRVLVVADPEEQALFQGVEARQGYAVIRRPEFDASGHLLLDPSGRVTITGLGPGTWRVGAFGHDIEGDEEVRIAPGELEVGVEIRLRRQLRLEGRVLAPGGEPVPKAHVLVHEPDERPHPGYYPAQEDGSFSIAVSDGDTYLLGASAPGFASAAPALPVRVEGEPVGGIELRLGEAVALTGRVVGLAPADLLEVMLLARQGEIQHSSRVDPEGSFRLPDLGPGPWEVTARVGHRVASASVALGETSPAEPLELVFPPERLTLSGRVTGGTAAVHEVELLLSGDPWRVAGDWTDAAGGFRFAGLAPGTYRLRVRDPFAVEVVHEARVVLEGDRALVVTLAAAE